MMLSAWDERKSQEKRILKLLRSQDIVKTAELRLFTYNHTARISNLRKKGYIIESVKDEKGRYGYRLLGQK